MRHVQVLKRTAAPFILSSFGLLMAIQLVTCAVFSYLKYDVEPKVICTHIVKCHLNCVRNAPKRNSTVGMRLLEGSGIDYVS